LPDQELVKKIEKLEKEESRNGHYELVHIGKMASEPSLKYNSTLNASSKYTQSSTTTKECTHWCRNSDKNNDYNKHSTQASSLMNINGNNNNNTDNSIGNQQLGSTNFYILRTRTHTKSLSTRISSLKRESKTTRTLSIVMFTFIACWLPFFIHYLLVGAKFLYSHQHVAHYHLGTMKNKIISHFYLFLIIGKWIIFMRMSTNLVFMNLTLKNPFYEKSDKTDTKNTILDQLITWLGM
jgi:hypothetical protein